MRYALIKSRVYLLDKKMFLINTDRPRCVTPSKILICLDIWLVGCRSAWFERWCRVSAKKLLIHFCDVLNVWKEEYFLLTLCITAQIMILSLTLTIGYQMLMTTIFCALHWVKLYVIFFETRTSDSAHIDEIHVKTPFSRKSLNISNALSMIDSQRLQNHVRQH